MNGWSDFNISLSTLQIYDELPSKCDKIKAKQRPFKLNNNILCRIKTENDNNWLLLKEFFKEVDGKQKIICKGSIFRQSQTNSHQTLVCLEEMFHGDDKFIYINNLKHSKDFLYRSQSSFWLLQWID